MPWIGPDARNALFYDSVADMKLGKNFDGSTVITNGYYKPNDGGGGTYIVRAKKETDVDDGGSIHFLMDDLVAELIVDENQYNVANYDGDTLNEKWDNMRKKFKYFAYKKIIVPPPNKMNRACIVVGDDVKWKISAPLIIDSRFSLSTIRIDGEIMPIKPVSCVIKIYDEATKPDNIVFESPISIRGDRFSVNEYGEKLTIDKAIEISCGARICFDEDIYVNDCVDGIVVGGENQVHPTNVTFKNIYVSFFDNTALTISGKSETNNIGMPLVTSLNADCVYANIALKENVSAVKITGRVNGLFAKSICYATDNNRDNYITHDAMAVVDIDSNDAIMRYIVIEHILGTTSTYGLYINNKTPSKIFHLDIGEVGIPKSKACAVYARNCNLMNIGTILNDNIVDIFECYNSKVDFIIDIANSNADYNVSLNGIVFDEKTPIGNIPNVSRGRSGLITVVKNQYGSKAYLNIGDENIPFDGKMFVPIIEELPAPAWNFRGKMYMVIHDDGQDVIAICVRTGGNSYRWFDLISNSFI